MIFIKGNYTKSKWIFWTLAVTPHPPTGPSDWVCSEHSFKIVWILQIVWICLCDKNFAWVVKIHQTRFEALAHRCKKNLVIILIVKQTLTKLMVKPSPGLVVLDTRGLVRVLNSRIIQYLHVHVNIVQCSSFCACQLVCWHRSHNVNAYILFWLHKLLTEFQSEWWYKCNLRGFFYSTLAVSKLDFFLVAVEYPGHSHQMLV